MSEIRIASRYASSLLGLAEEQGKLDAVQNDMQQFKSACEGSRELVNMLKSPIVTPALKRQVLDKTFGSFQDLSKLFLQTVVRKGREAYLPMIASEYLAQYNEKKNIAKAVVTTANPINADMVAKIKKELEVKTGKTIEIETQVDASIIGGLVVRINDSLFDASIANSLKKIKKELVLN
ncbi:MAG: ATP synthase F1 subunit delta [Bacteroidetes bacterium]|nr:MAG: ATP synthase F1 subunit delta [Bacteroidota bacterium]